MRELPYVVECRMGKFFEPIAAFNCRRAAEAYLDECAKVNPHFTYRVNFHCIGEARE